MNKIIGEAHRIARKPDEEITVGDVARLLAGFQRIIIFLFTLFGAAQIGFMWLGGRLESPAAITAQLRYVIAKQDTVHDARMTMIENAVLIMFRHSQQQSYQLCITQPHARQADCAKVLLDRSIDSIFSRVPRLR